MTATITGVQTSETPAEKNNTPQSQTGDRLTTSDAQNTTRKWEPNITTLLLTLIPVMLGILMWQIDSLGDRINTNGDRIGANSDRIENLGTQLRAEMNNLETNLRTELQTEINGLRTELQTEISGLRAEMQSGFAEIHAILRDHTAILIDHTDRLARLETAAGLPRPNN